MQLSSTTITTTLKRATAGRHAITHESRLHIMDSIDWEPEVPGQWKNLRIRSQRAAAEAAHSNTLSHAETPVAEDYVCSLIPLAHLVS